MEKRIVTILKLATVMALLGVLLLLQFLANHYFSSKSTRPLELRSIAALRDFSAERLMADDNVEVLGYYDPGDGGGGRFLWVPEGGGTDDGGIVVKPDAGKGFWRRILPATGVVSPRMFGAKGDGVHDDTAAIRAAMRHLMRAQPHEVYGEINRMTGRIEFGSGNFAVSHRVFDDIVNGEEIVARRAPYVGFTFQGVHNESTILTLKTRGQESWFYRNPHGTSILQRLYFNNIQFTSDDYRLGNGFRQWSDGGVKQFNFLNCKFERLNNLFWTEGTGNADLNSFINCKGMIHGTILTLNNSQSVAHDFFKCDLGTFGHFINVLAKGGGNVAVNGGAIDFAYYEGRSPPTGNFLVHLEQGANVAQGNMTFTFRSCRIEIEAYQMTDKAPPLGLVRAPGFPSIGTPRITFDNVNFVNGRTYPIADSNPEVPWNHTAGLSSAKRIVAVDIHERVFVHFTNSCVLLKNFFYRIGGSYANSGSPNSGGVVKIDNCFDGVLDELPGADSSNENIHDRVMFTGNIGRFVTSGVSSHTTGSVYERHIFDYDQGARRATAREEPSVRRIVHLKRAGIAWPTPDGVNDIVVNLPPNFLALRIYLSKPASHGAGRYQLKLTNEDKTVTLASSTAGSFSEAHVIDVSHLELGDYRKIRLCAEGDALNVFQDAGIGYIEY